jgi:hypothetical protein
MWPAQTAFSLLLRGANTPQSAVHDAVDSVAIRAAAPVFDIDTNT